MSIVLWGILALVGGLAALWWAARSARPADPPLPPDLPATPLQRVARWSVGAGALFTVAAAGLVAGKGVEVTFASDPLASPSCCSSWRSSSWPARRRSGQGPGRS